MNVHTVPVQGWSDGETDLLRQLWSEGLSVREIQSQIPRSRGSIIGKVDRLGLPTRGNLQEPSRPRGPRPVYGRTTRQYVPRKPSLRLVISNAQKIEKAKTWHPLDGTEPITILDRTRHQCAWPVDRPHEIGKPFVCGQAVVEGESYCGSHCRIAYVPRKRA